MQEKAQPFVAVEFGRGCGVSVGSFRDDFDEEAVGEGRAAEDVDDAVAGEAAEHLGCLRWGRARRSFTGSRSGTRSGGGSWGRRSWGAVGAAVHGLVGEAVGVLVFVAEGVGDFELVELGDAAFGFFPEGAEIGGVDLVLALDLLDHQLGVGDDTEAGVAVVERPLEAAEEAGVLGVVVGAVAEELGELGEDVAGFVLQDGAVAGRARVAACAAVTMGGDPAGFGRGGGAGGDDGIWEKRWHRFECIWGGVEGEFIWAGAAIFRGVGSSIWVYGSYP